MTVLHGNVKGSDWPRRFILSHYFIGIRLRLLEYVAHDVSVRVWGRGGLPTSRKSGCRDRVRIQGPSIPIKNTPLMTSFHKTLHPKRFHPFL